MKKLIHKFLGSAVCLLVLGGLAFQHGSEAHASGDDLIGSLPIMYPHESSTSPNPTVEPSIGGDGAEAYTPVTFVLEGTMRDVEELVHDAYGVGYVQVEKTCNPKVFKYVFIGNVVIDLDRREAQYGRVRLLSRTGVDYVNGKATLVWQGQPVDQFKVMSEELELPYAELLVQGIADLGVIGLEYYKPKAYQAFLTLSASPNLVRINSVTK